jgi:hypothetical protein
VVANVKEGCITSIFRVEDFNSTLKMEQICSSETLVTTKIHGETTQKIRIYISTAVKTLNLGRK